MCEQAVVDDNRAILKFILIELEWPEIENNGCHILLRKIIQLKRVEIFRDFHLELTPSDIMDIDGPLEMRALYFDRPLEIYISNRFDWQRIVGASGEREIIETFMCNDITESLFRGIVEGDNVAIAMGPPIPYHNSIFRDKTRAAWIPLARFIGYPSIFQIFHALIPYGCVKICKYLMMERDITWCSGMREYCMQNPVQIGIARLNRTNPEQSIQILKALGCPPPDYDEMLTLSLQHDNEAMFDMVLREWGHAKVRNAAWRLLEKNTVGHDMLLSVGCVYFRFLEHCMADVSSSYLQQLLKAMTDGYLSDYLEGLFNALQKSNQWARINELDIVAALSNKVDIFKTLEWSMTYDLPRLEWESLLTKVDRVRTVTPLHIRILKRAIDKKILPLGVYLASFVAKNCIITAESTIRWFNWLFERGVSFESRRGDLYFLVSKRVTYRTTTLDSNIPRYSGYRRYVTKTAVYDTTKEFLQWLYDHGQYPTIDALVHLITCKPDVAISWINQNPAIALHVDPNRFYKQLTNKLYDDTSTCDLLDIACLRFPRPIGTLMKWLHEVFPPGDYCLTGKLMLPLSIFHQVLDFPVTLEATIRILGDIQPSEYNTMANYLRPHLSESDFEIAEKSGKIIRNDRIARHMEDVD